MIPNTPDHTKEVYYYMYCVKCKHNGSNDIENPCNECLTQGWNIDSHKPINFSEG